MEALPDVLPDRENRKQRAEMRTGDRPLPELGGGGGGASGSGDRARAPRTRAASRIATAEVRPPTEHDLLVSSLTSDNIPDGSFDPPSKGRTEELPPLQVPDDGLARGRAPWNRAGGREGGSRRAPALAPRASSINSDGGFDELSQVHEIFNSGLQFNWHVVSTIVDEAQDPNAALQIGGTRLDESSAVLFVTSLGSARGIKRWLKSQRAQELPPTIAIILGPSDNQVFQVEVVKVQRDLLYMGMIDDVIINPGFGHDLRLAISMSLVRAEMKQSVVDRFEAEMERAESANGGCGLFWRIVHRVFEEFPHLDTNPPEELAPGQEIGGCVLERCIGGGGFGEVWSAINSETSEPQAIKVVAKSTLTELSSVGKVWREIKILRRMDHENIIGFRAAVHGHKHIFIAMELGGKQNLFQVLNKRRGGLAMNLSIKYMGELSCAVQHLHDHGVAHRDLKPENISVTSQGQIKVLDFGSVTAIQKMCCDMAGTMPFMAPEIMLADNREEYNPSRCDVWSLGGVLLELLCGTGKLSRMLGWSQNHEPCPDRCEELAQFLQEPGNLHLALEVDLGTNVGQNLVQLLEGMLALELSSRLTAKRVCASTWLAQQDAMQ